MERTIEDRANGDLFKILIIDVDPTKDNNPMPAGQKFFAATIRIGASDR